MTKRAGNVGGTGAFAYLVSFWLVGAVVTILFGTASLAFFDASRGGAAAARAGDVPIDLTSSRSGTVRYNNSRTVSTRVEAQLNLRDAKAEIPLSSGAERPPRSEITLPHGDERDRLFQAFKSKIDGVLTLDQAKEE